MDKFTEILNLVSTERYIQNQKFGEQNHNTVEWVAIIGEEFGEASKEAVDFHFKNPIKIQGEYHDASESLQELRLSNFKEELIQLAAVTIQAIESIQRQEENGTLKIKQDAEEQEQ